MRTPGSIAAARGSHALALEQPEVRHRRLPDFIRRVADVPLEPAG